VDPIARPRRGAELVAPEAGQPFRPARATDVARRHDFEHRLRHWPWLLRNRRIWTLCWDQNVLLSPERGRLPGGAAALSLRAQLGELLPHGSELLLLALQFV